MYNKYLKNTGIVISEPQGKVLDYLNQVSEAADYEILSNTKLGFHQVNESIDFLDRQGLVQIDPGTDYRVVTLKDSGRQAAAAFHNPNISVSVFVKNKF